VLVGRRVRLGWLWIITHRGIQCRECGVEMRMGIELVEIVILLAWGLGLRLVEGKLARKVVVGMGWGMLLLLMLVIVRGR